MAAQMNFGEVLRLARERKGIDLPSAARRLRIRPDILKAIEDNDFSRMPPRGYARNMVNAYARMLGLNPTEITKLYLDEAYAYQVGRARDDSMTRGAGVSVASTRREARRQSRDDEDRTSRDGYTSPLGRRQYSDARTEEYRVPTTPAPSRNRRFNMDRSTHPSRGAVLPNSHYTNFYAGPAAPNGIRSKLPFIIGGAVILVLLIIVLVLVFGGGRGATQTEDLSTVPITGIDDPEAGQTTDGDGTQTPSTPVAPTSVEVAYSIADGASPWVEISQDGTMVTAEAMSSGAHDTIDVTGSLTIATAQPGNVTVTVDGESVDWNDDGNGMYSITVDFNAFLETWREENGVSDTPKSSNDGTPENTSDDDAPSDTADDTTPTND